MKFFLGILFLFSFLFAQDTIEVSTNPCDDPLLELAGKSGIKSIPLKDIRRFKKLMKACNEIGGENIVDQIIYKDWQRDYKKTKVMMSWTSTYSVCIFFVMIYFFLGQIIGP